MEVQELEISHIQLTEEKLRLLEIQVAGLISDVIMLKAWKSEMSKFHLPLDTSCTQSEAVVPTSDIKQGQVSGTIIGTANDQKATQCSDTSISCVQPEAVVPTSDIKQGQVNGTIIGTANDQKATQCSDTSISCVQPEAVVPTFGVKQEQVVIDTITETVNHQEATQSSDTSISSIQLESVVPASDVKQGQVVSDTIIETAKDQKAAQECSDTSIQPESMVPTYDVKQGQVVSNTIIEMANGQMAAQERSDTRIYKSLDCTSSSSTAENVGMVKCENETQDLKYELSTLEETTSLSDKNVPVITAVDTQERLSEIGGATKGFKQENSWISLIEEEEQQALPSDCIPSEQVLKQSWSSNTSQLEASVTSQESKKHGATPCKMGNKHSVLEKLVNSAVHCGASDCGNNKNTAIDSSKPRFDRQKTDNMVCSPEKQKIELHSSGVENKKIVHSPNKQKSVASSIQANEETDSEQKVQNKNALFAYTMKHKALLQQKKVEEEQIMQDTSATIKEKKCSTCQCKIAIHKDTKESEEDDNVLVEVVKKMSKEKLQKKYLELGKRHQKLVNAICDPNTLALPDDPHALLNAARDGKVEEAILYTFSATMMDFRDEDGYAPLHLAVWSEHIQICKLLLAYNMPVSVNDNQGNTPLHFAARKGNVEICRVLLDWLAPVNATNTFGTAPLHCAVKEGHAQVCFFLVNKGASVNLGDKWNNTALHMAACNGFIEICQLLVKQGAEVNKQNSMGNTPLHNACKAGHFEVVQYLVKKGALLSIKCKKGKTPKEVINTLTHSNLMEWLAKWEKRICSDLDSLLVNLS